MINWAMFKCVDCGIVFQDPLNKFTEGYFCTPCVGKRVEKIRGDGKK